MKNILQYNLIFKPESEGGFTVIVPSLPGCVTYGKNLKEAKSMAEDAIKGYIVSLRKHNEVVPTDSDNFVATLDVNFQAEPLKKMIYA